MLGVIGNISRDRAIYPGGRHVELLGGAALHVALAATRAGLRSAPVAVIGSDLGWIRDDARLTDMDLSCVEVTCGRSCSFRLAYDNSGRLTGTGSSFGVAAQLTRHALAVLGQHPSYHVCCRRPLDVPAVLGRLVRAGIPFSVDFHLASAAVTIPAADAAIAQASVVFVNAAEFAALARVTDPGRLKAVVISDGPRPVTMLRSGQVVASVLPSDEPPRPRRHRGWQPRDGTGPLRASSLRQGRNGHVARTEAWRSGADRAGRGPAARPGHPRARRVSGHGRVSMTAVISAFPASYGAVCRNASRGRGAAEI